MPTSSPKNQSYRMIPPQANANWEASKMGGSVRSVIPDNQWQPRSRPMQGPAETPPAPVGTRPPHMQYPSGQVTHRRGYEAGYDAQRPQGYAAVQRHAQPAALNDRPWGWDARPPCRTPPGPAHRPSEGCRPEPPSRPTPPMGAPPGGNREAMLRGVLGNDADLVNVNRLMAQTARMGMTEALKVVEDEKLAVMMKRAGASVSGRYRSEGRVLGEGSFAFVVNGTDMQSGRDVALKVLRPRFAAEARIERDILQQMRGVAGGAKIIQMLDYIDGGDSQPTTIVFPLLGPHLGRMLKGGLSRDGVRRLAQQLLHAVAAMHSCGVVHTDIRPENIVCDSPKGGESYTLLDFGNASVHRKGERERDEINTRPYRAPEVIMRSGWTFPCDVWAVGCTFYEAATGERLFPNICDDRAHMGAVERVVAGSRGRARDWPHPQAQSFDNSLESILGLCLTPDAAHRISAADAARHHFVTAPETTA
eukprot:Hpha_TRINITY_DN16162_c1_g5::TRINITY_DN16162_c1_g5_i1::g.9054::m.9054